MTLSEICLRAAGACFLCVGLTHIAAAQVGLPANAVQLTSSEIEAAFANVRDNAEVQDGRGGEAVNHWFADGRFTSEWRSAAGRGTVSGYWRAVDDRRCIIIETGLPERAGVEECTPLYRLDNQYISVNAAGTVHGLHTLSPITTAD
ncbi:MAG: hypothetical protein NXH81_08740 [Halieaceae bacterium]|jgi:hypothetical protein|uniref:hypothetical protein n=1 Tax=Haliea alexandrii TaxID=2448162 RepID=UPI000F0B0574|nr:hypothetical protein [Haliea alexandrii]MCR9185469.1 hypothetical protein [Halieaceae bacterium]